MSVGSEPGGPGSDGAGHGTEPQSASPVGALLRATRQQHGLGVQDVAASLRIRAPYIAAIEEGRLSDLPAPAYAVGFVKAYAKALGLDEAEILRRFRAEADGLARRTRLEFPAPVPERGVPAGALALLGILLAAGLYAGWWYASGRTMRIQEAMLAPPDRLLTGEASRAAPPPIVLPPAAPADPRLSGPLASLPLIPPAANEQVAVIPPVQSPAPAPPAAQAAVPLGAPANPASAQAAVPPLALGPGGALPEGMFGAAGNEESRVLVRARAETWIQVRDKASGSVLFNRTLKTGEAYRVPLKPGLLLTMGNAPGTDVLVDGQLVANPFPTTSVRRDIPLEPDRVRDGMAAAPTQARAPATPAAPSASAGQGGWNWGTGGPSSGPSSGASN